jgi:PAS domain S-box-containing protein
MGGELMCPLSNRKPGSGSSKEKTVRAAGPAENEELYRSLIDSIYDIILITNNSGELLYANPALERQTAINTADISAVPDESPHYHPDEVDRLRHHRTKLLESNLIHSGPSEIRLINSDGSTFWYSTVISKITYQNKPALQYAMHEISEQKQLMDALRLNEEKYRKVYQTAPLAFVVWDRDCCVTEWNHRAEELFGWKREEILGKNFFDYIIPDNTRARVEAIVRSLLAGEFPSHSINDNLTRSGRIILCEWNNSILFDSSGQIIGAMSLGLDITERHRAELALIESEENYRLVFEKANDGILTVINDQISNCNAKFLDMVGRQRSELIGKHPWDISPPVQPEGSGSRELAQQFMDVAYEGARPRFDWIHSKPDGTPVYVEVSLNRIRPEKEPTLLCVVRDISERKEAEESLRQAFMEIEQLKNQLQAENIYLREEIKTTAQYGDIVGDSNALRSTLRQIELVAPTDSTVLVLGESGTGKELVAREIHNRSARKDRSIIKVNCASITKTLYESEFFGHVKGAFTSAVRDRAGRFELANKGTIFLDEVGEISLDMQSKLLRVLQEGQYERVGDDKTRDTDVRVIAASNRDLRREVENGRFREDLYYRLNVFPITVAPLRQRKEDIPLLAMHFLSMLCAKANRPFPKLTRANITMLQSYPWPGNVRELQNVIERALITSQGNMLDFELPMVHSGSTINNATHAAQAPGKKEIMTEVEIRRFERDNIIAALDHTKWHVFGPDGAAALLGLKPTTLVSRMKKYSIEKPGK